MQIIVTGTLLGGTYALIALGLTLQYGAARIMNLANGETLVAACFVSFWLFTAMGVNPLLGMIAFGFWGKRRATTQSDFLVAGRRLGPMLYSGTMAAIVLGGASTIGGVGLGYEYGISGMWLVTVSAPASWR